MLRALIRKQMAEIFRSYFYDAKKNKARSRGATIGFIVMYVLLMVVVLGGMFTGLSVRPMMPVAIKMLFSKKRLNMDDALIQKLKVMKEDIRLMKMYNMMTVL